MFQKLIRFFSMHTGRAEWLYKHVGKPDYLEYPEWLRRHRKMKIGENTTINCGALFMDEGLVTIGKECSISAATFVTHSGGDRIAALRWGVHAESRRPITIGDGVTIGINATILYGVTIGDDAFIGAGSYISNDVPAGTMMRPPEARAEGTTESYVRRLEQRDNVRRLSPKRRRGAGERVDSIYGDLPARAL